MPGEDNLSSRFDYLFEPLEAEESDGDATDAESSATRPSRDTARSRSGAPVRMAFAAFILGTLGAVAVVAALLLQQPNTSTQPVDSQLESTPLSTTVPVMTPQPGPAPPPETTATETPTESPQTIESAPRQQTEAPQPTTSQRTPETHVTNSPTTRAPMSVAPQTRAPFPNQGGQRGGPNQGDLIPGVGLPGPL
jgi:outer membrane biosynthesis protein TonB